MQTRRNENATEEGTDPNARGNPRIRRSDWIFSGEIPWSIPSGTLPCRFRRGLCPVHSARVFALPDAPSDASRTLSKSDRSQRSPEIEDASNSEKSPKRGKGNESHRSPVGIPSRDFRKPDSIKRASSLKESARDDPHSLSFSFLSFLTSAFSEKVPSNGTPFHHPSVIPRRPCIIRDRFDYRDLFFEVTILSIYDLFWKFSRMKEGPSGIFHALSL